MHRLKRADHRPGQVVLLGSGTIGGQVLRFLRRSGMDPMASTRVPWTDRPERVRTFESVFSDLPASNVDLIWAAGATGFAADQSEAERELEVFSDVLDTFTRALDRSGSDNPAVHLISSAGGLFEGRHVSSVTDAPAPSRPYGLLKLEQESKLGALASGAAVHVHRPSSVYSDARLGRRPGLIGALLKNGMSRSPTSIIGSLDTLRDYVHAQDIGQFVARRVIDAERSPGVRTNFLVNGAPASIHRVIDTVERTVRRKIIIQFRDAWNSANITFSPAVRAPEFRPMDIAVGAAVTFVTMEQAGDLF